MKLRLLIPMVFCLALGLTWTTATRAADMTGLPAHQVYDLLPLDRIPVQQTVFIEARTLADEDRQDEADGRPTRFALPQAVSLTPATDGQWEDPQNGRRVWRQRVTCPGALSLNLGFDRCVLPPDSRLQIYATNGLGPVLGYDDRDNRDHGQLWTPVLLSDDIVVELEVPAEYQTAVDLHISTIGRGYRFFGEKATEKSGACNIDVVCSQGDDWRDDIATVAVYSLGGSRFCTGVMVNNTAVDQKPLFLTAYHCDVRAHLAPTLVVYWNYESPTCGQQGGGSLADTQSGATLLAEYQPTDFALLELDDSPDSEWGVNFAGWNRSSANPDRAVAIHHPSTDEKSISFEDDPLTTTSYLGSAIPGDSSHLRVADWDLGTTEGGSSGSPLFDMQHHMVGQLHGGYAACGNDLSDWYGRLSVSWNGGGTSATRLRDWLDPGNVGVVTLDLLDPENPPEPPEPLPGADLRIIDRDENPFVGSVEIEYELSAAMSVKASVLNMRGARVYQWPATTGVEGRNTLEWNGHDGRGRRLPAGVYILSLEAGDTTLRMKLVMLH